jgi:hypothetical protein
MACVLYSTLFRARCDGIDYYAGLSQPEAAHFQFVASNIVLNDLALWNIIP